MPTRRAFLRSGGSALVGVVLLGGCTGDDDEPAVDEPDTTGDDSDDEGDGEGIAVTAGDLDLLTAAVQLEHSLLAVYDAMRERRSPDLDLTGATAFVALLRDHHDDAAAALNDLLTGNGAPAVPAGTTFAGIDPPDPDVVGRLPITLWLSDAHGLEHRLVQTAVTAVPRLTVPSFRRELMAIAAAEARHVAVFDLFLGGGIPAYDSTANRIAGGAYPTEASFLLG